MVRRVREQARVILSQMESGAGGKVKADADIRHWVIRWAASLISNYQVGEDGKNCIRTMEGQEVQNAISTFRREGVLHGIAGQ